MSLIGCSSRGPVAKSITIPSGAPSVVGRIEFLLKCKMRNALNSSRVENECLCAAFTLLSWKSNCAAALSFVYNFWHSCRSSPLEPPRKFGMQSGWKFIRLACLSCLQPWTAFTAEFNLLPGNRRPKLHPWYFDSQLTSRRLITDVSPGCKWKYLPLTWSPALAN